MHAAEPGATTVDGEQEIFEIGGVTVAAIADPSEDTARALDGVAVPEIVLDAVRFTNAKIPSDSAFVFNPQATQLDCPGVALHARLLPAESAAAPVEKLTLVKSDAEYDNVHCTPAVRFA